MTGEGSLLRGRSVSPSACSMPAFVGVCRAGDCRLVFPIVVARRSAGKTMTPNGISANHAPLRKCHRWCRRAIT